MFKPSSFIGIIFKFYLKSFSHLAKIRIQNILGKKLFYNGMNLKNQNGVTFNLDANDWITRIMLIEGNYESNSTNLANKILQDGGVFLDIGANFGLFTCITALANKNVNVYAIEPNYKIINRLVNNVTINNLQSQVKIINTAISNKLQTVTLNQPVSNNMGTTVASASTSGTISILSCPLEFICETFKLVTIDLVKIDIEGNEFEVLEFFEFDKYHIQNIILEFNELSKISFNELKSFFVSKQFKAFTITGKELINESDTILENNIWFVNQQGKKDK